MSIEQTLERVAVALEVIANNIAVVGGAQVPPPVNTNPPTDPSVDTRSPQQKAADTRKANAAKKAAEEAGAPGPTTPNNVTPINTAPAPVGQPDPANTAGPADNQANVAGLAYNIPSNLQEMQALAGQVFQQLGGETGQGNKIGEVLASTYQCSSLSALPVEYYAGFARDIAALVQS